VLDLLIYASFPTNTVSLVQDGVPAAIQTLLTANIRVWMITGDKMETAVNIAVSCRLVADPDSIMLLVVDEKQDGEHGCMLGVGGRV
jgi:phospholipid-transporting ATPase